MKWYRSLNFKITAMLILVTLLSASLSGTILFKRYYDSEIEHLNTALLRSANTTQLLLQLSDTQPYIDGGPVKNAFYMAKLHTLKDIVDTFGLTYLYVLDRTSPGSYRFLIDAAMLVDELQPLDPYEEVPAEVEDVYRSQKLIYPEVYTDEYGTFKSIFFPIISNGNTIAVVGADFDITFLSNIRNNVLMILFMAIALSSVAAIIISIFFSKRILSSLRKMDILVADLVKGDSDLTKRLDINDSSEIGNVAGGINDFIADIQHIVSDVKTRAITVSDSSDELASTTEELSVTFHQQSGQIGEIASAMEELSASSMEVLGSLESAMESSGQAAGKTTEGKAMLTQAVQGIDEIKDQIQKLGTTIGSLTESAAQIEEILEVINDIADQTNLLALNAAIEAARAGEAGRGFAVVADEVRKLAERTQKSTSEVEQIIHSLQKETGQAADNMKNAENSVQKGADVISSTEIVFDEIVSAVENIDHSNSMVNAAISEENQTIQSTSNHVQMIAAAVEQSSKATMDVATTVANLQEQAKDQSQLIKRFKT